MHTDGGPSINSQVGKVRMNGKEVFKHAVEKLSSCLIEAINSANLKRANFKNSIKLTCPQLQSAYIDKETIMPDYLVISGGQMSKATFWNYEIEVLTDYQCEKIKPLKTK